METTILKVDPEKRRFWGWAYVAKNADGTQVVDHSGDFVDDDAFPAFEDAAYNYVLESREGDLEHKSFGAARLIEHVVMTPAKAEMMGLSGEVPTGMWVGYQADDDSLWEGVKSGRLKSLSIVGKGRREQV